MGPSMPSPLIARFGVFELDLPREAKIAETWAKALGSGPTDSGFGFSQIENPGEVVTRDELQRRLWPADTYVNFEHSLNAAVKRLRQALGDSAENPTFVETLPRRGLPVHYT